MHCNLLSHSFREREKMKGTFRRRMAKDAGKLPKGDDFLDCRSICRLPRSLFLNKNSSVNKEFLFRCKKNVSSQVVPTHRSNICVTVHLSVTCYTMHPHTSTCRHVSKGILL